MEIHSNSPKLYYGFKIVFKREMIPENGICNEEVF